MRHQMLIQELKSLPELVQAAELAYYEAQNTFLETKQRILELEVKLFNEGKVDNKNELTRNASFLRHTEKLHRERIIAEHEMNKQKSEYYKLKHKMENTRIIAQLIMEEK